MLNIFLREYHIKDTYLLAGVLGVAGPVRLSALIYSSISGSIISIKNNKTRYYTFVCAAK